MFHAPFFYLKVCRLWFVVCGCCNSKEVQNYQQPQPQTTNYKIALAVLFHMIILSFPKRQRIPIIPTFAARKI